jgi:hypothetical protein
MKVVNFIDKRWNMAVNEIERNKVSRLFSLGFTKLYVLHALPTEKIDEMLSEGVEVPVRTGQTEWYSLESITIGQLKRAISQEPKLERHRAADQGSRPIVSLVAGQAKALLRLVEQCQNCNETELLNEQLNSIQEHATAILEGIKALSNSDGSDSKN